METTTIRVGAAILGADDVRPSVEFTIQAGRIARIRHAGSLTAAERSRIAVPGLINAHVHLDLGALDGAVPPDGGFLDWVRRLLEARDALSPARLEDGARRSADAALASGTTSVIDIDSCGVVANALRGSPLRRLSLVELIDGSPAAFDARSRAALEAARVALETAPDEGDRVAVGWSPHGTHTVGDELMARLGSLRRTAGGAAVAVHWAETPEEARWLRDGGGPFEAWLGPSPRISGIERLARAGLLEDALLVHGNAPEPDDPARIATAGAAVVHCPGSHLFFARDPFPLTTYDDAGVPVVLGTDSIASNRALDMRREMRLAVETLGVDVRRALRMATEWPARCLPWPGVTGRLEPGGAADLLLLDAGGASSPLVHPAAGSLDRALLEWFVFGEARLSEVWIAGCPVSR